MPNYVPDRGHIVWLDFTPQSGHEQAGRRPALVLSPAAYNGKTGLMICCPMTTRSKGYPFEVQIRGETPSVVLSDQVKCLDWQARHVSHKGQATAGEVAEVQAKLRTLIA